MVTCALALASAAATLSPPARAATAAAAPDCLPKTLNSSAQLPGLHVEVSPAPGSGLADPDAQVSFLGTPASRIRNVLVVGQRSGRHAGSLRPYSQGDGASFVPSKPFDAGEQVSVKAEIDGRQTAFSFAVDTPWSTAGVGSFPNPTPPASDYQTFVTMPGVQAPILTVTSADRDPSAGDILTSNGPGPGRYGPLIYDPQGRLIWFDQLPAGLVADDLAVQSYQGQRDLTFWEGRVISLGFGLGEDLILNSRYQTVATIKGGDGLEPDLHELQLEPGGIAYISAYNPIRCDLASVGGPRNGVILDAVAMAIDVKTGLVRWEWHALDHVSVNDSETSPSNRAWDWFHLNSIDPEPDGDVFISARNTWAGYQLQGSTGRILWTLGGIASSFKLGPGAQTAWQHDGRVLPNGEVTFFDDGSDPPAPSRDGAANAAYDQARGVTISVDLADHRARLVASLTHPGAPLLSGSQGNMQTLAGGDTLVAFGGVPEITEFSKRGTVLFDAHLPYDMIFYRAFRASWSGRPATAPAVVANLNNVGETIVHMSWNGATGVAAWRVLAGGRRSALKAAATVPDSGFESEAELPGGNGYGALPSSLRYVAVQALDRGGHVLATSPTVSIESYAAADPTGGTNK
ncbi:MAG: arylsulfotransferase family protein [Solirubrobacteraceae bacterium]|jgi:hypothetical protein